MRIKLKGNSFLLLPEKALLNVNARQLIIADIHLGKSTHFRKSGINLPSGGAVDDLALLNELILQHEPREVIILGDLFHSTINSEWKSMETFLLQNSGIGFVLVKGNHDLLKFSEMAIPNFNVVALYENDDFVFSHKPVTHSKFVLHGHVHPGVTIADGVLQSFRLPCFYIGDDHMILPAFGKLTGLQTVKKLKSSDRVFVIYNARVTEM